MRKKISLLLVFFMLFTMLPMAGFADGEPGYQSEEPGSVEGNGEVDPGTDPEAGDETGPGIEEGEQEEGKPEEGPKVEPETEPGQEPEKDPEAEPLPGETVTEPEEEEVTLEPEIEEIEPKLGIINFAPLREKDEKIDQDLSIIEDFFKGKTEMKLGGSKIYFELAEGGDVNNSYSNPYETITYGTGEGEYTNIYTYLRDKAAQLTERDPSEITVSAGAGFLGTIASGTPLAATIMDDIQLGNLTPQYFENYPTTLYIGAAAGTTNEVKFTIGDKTVGVGQVYFAVQPLAANAQKKVELEASAITWERIQGLPNTNPDRDNIRGKVGMLTGSSVGNLPDIAIYKSTDAGVEIKWSITYTGIGSDPESLSLATNQKSTVFGKRPNVEESDAKYQLIATLTSKEDTNVKENIKFDLTVPAFSARKVPIRVVPSEATINVTDSYYGKEVDERYIEISENRALRTYTLHGAVTDSPQSYSFNVSAPGYISSTRVVSVTGDMPEQEISLIPSSADDAKLSNLEITNPESNSASIQIPMDAFGPDKLDYHMTVGGIASVTIKPTALTEGAEISVNRHSSVANANKGTFTDTKVNSGSNSTCYLKTGEEESTDTIITLTVTAPKSSTQENTTKVYKITVTRENVTYPLTGLTLTSIGGSKNNSALPAEEVLSPKIEVGGLAEEYVYYVNYTREKITLKPIAAGSKISINGVEVDSGTSSEEISLTPGNNLIKIEVTPDNGEKVEYNLVVCRKQEISFGGFLSDGLMPRPATGEWIYSYNFQHHLQTLELSPDIPEGAILTIPGIEGEFVKGDKINLSVNDIAENGYKIISGIKVSQKFTENEKEWIDEYGYVVSFYRMASDFPTRVESYLPAPGQFVNQDSYRFPEKTLSVTSSMVTLGAYGGSIVYYFEEPIQNHPNNPYGIDMIVYGNAFENTDGTSASGASEPAAVMVSNDGNTWYELAGSMYYDAQTRHNVSVTYTNPDKSFSGSKDVTWIDDSGNSGAIKTVGSHKQAYYPNPVLYDVYNTGVGKNASYTDSNVTMTFGSLFNKKYSPRYGYGDVHANSNPISNKAMNPYVENHYRTFNGDGIDLAWAVDTDGNPVEINEAKYVKFYNPTLFDGGTTGEVSPEIVGVYRVSPVSSPVGLSRGLTELKINGEILTLNPDTYEYEFYQEGISTLVVTPSAEFQSANIVINDHWVASGSASPMMLAGEKIRIVVQEGDMQPVIYTISIKGGTDLKDDARIEMIYVTPGDKQAKEKDKNNYEVTVSNEVKNIRVQAIPLFDGAKVKIGETPVTAEGNWLTEQTIALTAGEANEIPITITSASGKNIETYLLSVIREASSGTVTPELIQIGLTLIGDSKHGSPETHENFVTWINKKSYSVPQGSTVKYLTDFALIEEGFSFLTNSEGTYIESINGLAAFDNGPNSGWMYRVNGTIGGVGYADYVLKANDDVLWFYTDDFTKETGYDNSNWDNSGGGGGSGAGQTVVPETAIQDGKGISDLGLTAMKDAIANAKINNADIIIEPKTTSDLKAMEVSISKEALSEITKQTEASLIVKTPIATVNIPQDALVSLTSQAAGSTIAITVESVETSKLTAEQKELVKESPVFDISIKTGDKNISSFNGKEITISLPYTLKADEKAADVKVWYLNDAGQLEKMTCTYDEKTGLATFTTNHLSKFMVGVEVAEVKPVPVATISFTDVSAADWFYDAVKFAVEKGLFKGTSENTFSPNQATTRAMVVSVLHRLSGEPAGYKSSFTDVNENDWFVEPVAWAAANNVVSGYGQGLFGPNDQVTREQLAGILHRYAQSKGYELTKTKDLSGYKDASAISPWAKEVIAWANAEGLINGRSADLLAPGESATRAEVAAILQRFIENFMK